MRCFNIGSTRGARFGKLRGGAWSGGYVLLGEVRTAERKLAASDAATSPADAAAPAPLAVAPVPTSNANGATTTAPPPPALRQLRLRPPRWVRRLCGRAWYAVTRAARDAREAALLHAVKLPLLGLLCCGVQAFDLLHSGWVVLFLLAGGLEASRARRLFWLLPLYTAAVLLLQAAWLVIPEAPEAIATNGTGEPSLWADLVGVHSSTGEGGEGARRLGPAALLLPLLTAQAMLFR